MGWESNTLEIEVSNGTPLSFLSLLMEEKGGVRAREKNLGKRMLDIDSQNPIEVEELPDPK